MTRWIGILISLAAIAHAQHHHAPAPQKTTVTLDPGLAVVHHPVTTSSKDSQQFFDQGLALIYAFNHEEAIRSFERALELDPNLAMAHWGIALALGPNINLDIDPEREKTAYGEVQKARSLASKASPQERDTIETLAKRYSIDPKADLKKLSLDYKNAMGELVKKYPDDLDVATLYAEAVMDLRPWQWWSVDGKPAEGTLEIIEVLESVLRRDPDHPGANHYYIHAVEASPDPDRAMASARRLEALVPSAGHLVHMPSHIYMRTGDYKQAAESNARAAAVDRDYIAKRGADGFYPQMYYNHNLHFLASAHAMEGRLEDAMTAAEQVQDNVAPSIKGMPEMAMFQGPTAWPVLMLVRFAQWDEVLKTDDNGAGPQATAVWRFGRGVAHAALGHVAEAEKEQKELAAVLKQVKPDENYLLNKAKDIFAVAETVLAARIAAAKGETNRAVELLRIAVTLEDNLQYDEPPNWPLPVRESLGGLLLRAARYAEAESVFRADLERNRRSGRSLFGLAQALRAQGKNAAADSVQRQFRKAWSRADVNLTVDQL